MPAPWTPPETDRLPPHSSDAERGVLGCIIADNSCMAAAIERLSADSFYDPACQAVFSACLDLYDTNSPIDLITLHQRLRDSNLLEKVGGLDFLTSLESCIPSAANLPYYLDIVSEKAQARHFIAIATAAVSRAYNCQGSPHAVLAEFESELCRLLNPTSRTTTDIRQACLDALAQIEKAHAGGGQTGVPTGFRDLDRLTCGLQPANLIIAAGRPSVGKTSIALNIAEHVAVEHKLPVGVFSLEMTSTELVLRLLCARARVDAHAIRRGFLTERDFPRIATAAGEISRAPIFIDDAGGINLTQLRAKARRMVQLHEIKLLIIDYLGLLTLGKRAESRQAEVSAISNGIKALAKDLNIPVLLLCQLNREVEKTKGKTTQARKPRLSDLRESGAIEQDADLVFLLWKPDETENAVDLDVAKQRNGPTGTVKLVFLPQYTRFESAAQVSNDDIPRHNDP